MCKWSKVTVPREIALNKTFRKDQIAVQASPTEKVLLERFLGRLRLQTAPGESRVLREALQAPGLRLTTFVTRFLMVAQ